jgi:hypothetical protein
MDMRLAEIQEAFHVRPRARQWQPRRMGARKRKPLKGGRGGCHRGTSPDGLDWEESMCLDHATIMTAPPDVGGWVRSRRSAGLSLRRPGPRRAGARGEHAAPGAGLRGRQRGIRILEGRSRPGRAHLPLGGGGGGRWSALDDDDLRIDAPIADGLRRALSRLNGAAHEEPFCT